MLKTSILALIILAAAASSSFARPGDTAHPIVLKMKRGTDSLTIKGVLIQDVDCCAYTFKAKAGQKLYWTETGAATRVGLAYPNGDGINPGLPSPTDLPQDGAYVFTLSPDTMADGAFGKFTVKIRIPPR